MAAAASVDEYIAGFPHDVQEVLQTVRATIRAQLPADATERISYAIPAFAVDGNVVVFYSGWKQHISMYPVPSGTEAFQRRIAPHVTGKGTLSFQLSQPMPLPMIAEITRARLRDHRASQASSTKKAASKTATSKKASSK
jgi:uncharacterized protein YdhG (YjbR/CyaY superfamily)